MEAAVKILRHRRYVAAAGMLLIVFAATMATFDRRCIAERGIGRLKVGMTFDEVEAAIGGEYICSEDFFDGTRWRKWSFFDGSDAHLMFDKADRLESADFYGADLSCAFRRLMQNLAEFLSTHC